MSGALLCLALVAPAADAAAVLQALEAAGRELKTMQAEFVETKVIVLLDEKQESKGEVLLQVPGRLRWNYRQPQDSALLIRDGRFERYFPSSKQVFRGEARGEAIFVGFGPGAAGLGRKYDVSLVGEEKLGPLAAFVLDLEARAGQSGLFASIRLWVDKSRSIPVQTRLTEPTGDHTTIRFERVQLNQRLPSGAFDLKLPRDVVEVK